jgi:hypothetical protein
MGWDPFGIEKEHARVRKAIAAGDEGYAQSDVSGTMVSIHVDGDGPPDIIRAPLDGMKYHDMLQEMIVDVASGEGIASPRVFRRSFVNWMIDDRRAYSKETWPKKDAEANRLETLLTSRPALFF